VPSQDKPQRHYHTLSSEALDHLWGKKGDQEAKLTLEERKIIRDLATNPLTEIAEPQIRIAPRFWLQFKKNRSGRVRMWLELDESLTVEKIKGLWPEIRQWQKFLHDWQGSSSSVADRYLLSLEKRHRRGATYVDVAESVGDDAISWLVWYRGNDLEEFEKALSHIDDLSDEDMNHWASECSAALQLLRQAGAKNEESLRDWLFSAFKYLVSTRKLKTKPKVPVTRQNMIDTLKAFRKRFKLKDGVEKIG